MVSQIKSKTVTRNNSGADDDAHGRGSDASMGGIVMRRCACGNPDGGRYAWGRIRSRRRSCRHSVSMKRVGFYVTGPRSGSLVASLVPVGWQVRVFGISGLIDRPSDHMYVRTIPLSGCMCRRSCYKEIKYAGFPIASTTHKVTCKVFEKKVERWRW